MNESSNNQARSKRKRRPDEDVSFDALVSPNFEELARRFPDFGRAWTAVQQAQTAAAADTSSSKSLASHVTQEFSIALTKALLHVHWGLALTNVPLHHLCPPVPNRYFYVQWMQQTLLPLLTDAQYFQRQSTSNRPLMTRRGLDIGTGTTCIYPLLFTASTKDEYQLFATEIDSESVHLAEQNVQSNRSESLIHVLQVPPTDLQRDASNESLTRVGPLRQSLQVIPEQQRALDFCMTNPPFYDDSEISAERTNPRAGDRRSRTAMTVSEGSYPGGEVGFVLDMIVDGLVLYIQGLPVPGWSSCMCGKKTSWVQLKHIVEQLLGPGHVQSTEFGPGHMTRWFLAWSFDRRPQIRSPMATADEWKFTVQSLDSSSSVCSSSGNGSAACEEVIRRIQDYCHNLQGWELAVDIVSPPDACGRSRVVIREARPLALWRDDQVLPERIQRLLAEMDPALRMALLPAEGHFLLDVNTIAAQQGSQQAHVQVQAFQHSTHGKKTIEKIKSQLEGELCRTNRRWRRQLKRQQQEAAQAMDES